MASLDWESLLALSAPPTNTSSFSWERQLPSDALRSLVWAGWATTSFLSMIASGSLIAGVIACPEARASPFNIYLVFISLPDFLSGLFCGITCWTNLHHRWFTGGLSMCEWQMFVTTFMIAGSFWLNALVVHEIHRLVYATKTLSPYQAPSRQTVALKSSAVLILSAIVSTVHKWGSPYVAFPSQGMACTPGYGDTGSRQILLLLVIPLIAGIPTSYILYVAYDCWNKQLLKFDSVLSLEASRSHRLRKTISRLSRPSQRSDEASGVDAEDDASVGTAPQPGAPVNINHRMMHRRRQARSLYLYFARIFLVILVMWVPATVFLAIVHFPSVWGLFLGGMWAHLQGLASALMGMSKDDVRYAVISLYTCGRSRRTSPNVGVIQPTRQVHPSSSFDEDVSEHLPADMWLSTRHLNTHRRSERRSDGRKSERAVEAADMKASRLQRSATVPFVVEQAMLSRVSFAPVVLNKT